MNKSFLSLLLMGTAAVNALAIVPPREAFKDHPEQRISTILDVQKMEARLNAIHLNTYGNLSTNDGLGEYGKRNPTKIGAVNTIGSPTFPVILVEFSDVKMRETSTIEKFNRQLNEPGYADTDYSYKQNLITNKYKATGSVRDYFISQSNGLFSPTFEVVAKVTLNNPRAYYFSDSNGRTDVNTEKCIEDAVLAAMEQGVDFTKYNTKDNKDAYSSLVEAVPMVSCICAGYSQASVGQALYEYNKDATGLEMPWPHFSRLANSTGTNYGATIGNIKLMSYFVGNELGAATAYSGGKVTVKYSPIQGPGTFVHEFGHALGLPDFYCTNYSVTSGTPNYWSIMDHAPYFHEGYHLLGYTAYERILCGWLKYTELDAKAEAQHCTLYSYDDPNAPADATKAYVIKHPNSRKEYYVLENRQADGIFYPNEYGSGMLIFHVYFDYNKWEGNVLNNDANCLRYTVLSASGATTSGNAEFNGPIYKACLYPGPSNLYTELTDNSTPRAANAYNGVTKRMGRPIYNITMNNGVIDFDFLDATAGIESTTLFPAEQAPSAYDLTGRKIDGKVHGLYIQNGRARLSR